MGRSPGALEVKLEDDGENEEHLPYCNEPSINDRHEDSYVDRDVYIHDLEVMGHVRSSKTDFRLWSCIARMTKILHTSISVRLLTPERSSFMQQRESSHYGQHMRQEQVPLLRGGGWEGGGKSRRGSLC